jgi:hypothetical protein
MEEEIIVSGRACGACTLCCKVLGIPEIDKPKGEWCQHCDIGRGCGIYSDRPAVCRAFHCGYLTMPALGAHWFPARSKMIITSEFEGEQIAIQVDPSRPTAWREQPYYGEIKQWARAAAKDLQQVVVCIAKRQIVILPDEDVDLGEIAQDERIVIGEVVENGRLKLRAMKLRADDPRLTGIAAGAISGPAKNPFV